MKLIQFSQISFNATTAEVGLIYPLRCNNASMSFISYRLNISSLLSKKKRYEVDHEGCQLIISYRLVLYTTYRHSSPHFEIVNKLLNIEIYRIIPQTPPII